MLRGATCFYMVVPPPAPPSNVILATVRCMQLTGANRVVLEQPFEQQSHNCEVTSMSCCWPQVFKSSDYMVSEEARTPNVHSRQVRQCLAQWLVPTCWCSASCAGCTSLLLCLHVLCVLQSVGIPYNAPASDMPAFLGRMRVALCTALCALRSVQLQKFTE